MSAPTIQPFARVDSLSERALAAVGFRFTRLLLLKDRHGWLQLVVDWTADALVKYAHDGGRGSSLCWDYRAETIELSFPQVPAPYYRFDPPRAFQPDHIGESHVAGIEVGISVSRPRGRHRKGIVLPYDYSHHVKTKWGICAYYRPDGWWDGMPDKVVSEWSARYSLRKGRYTDTPRLAVGQGWQP